MHTTQTTGKLPTQHVSRLPPLPRCHAFPIERPAIRHALIPSTLVKQLSTLGHQEVTKG
jgi:hypothetical protein